MKSYKHHSLRSHHTFGLDVYAEEFVVLESREDLMDYNFRDQGQQRLILGGGSNILFTGDYPGVVVKVALKGIQIMEEDEVRVTVQVAAGEEWDAFVSYCVGKGWWGLENLSGIPGSVGSGPIQNIGAYGAELKDCLQKVEYFDVETGNILTISTEECQFGYRDSIFKRQFKGKVIITGVVFDLQKKGSPNLSYQSLAQRFSDQLEKIITPSQIRATVLDIRASKLPDPRIIGNAGSFFKNPSVGSEKLEELKEEFPGIIYFKSQRSAVSSQQSMNTKEKEIGKSISTADSQPPTADFKLAAGWLIEECGWKGYREGDAGVHKDQALVLVNYGNATGQQIFNLSERIVGSVREKFGIDLEREVNVI